MRPLSSTKAVYAFQEWTENFGRGVAPRSGAETPRTNARGGVLENNASAKWYRGNPQRVGAWARDETDQVSGAESRRLIALLHGRGLQCETISKSARLLDENTRSEPRMRAQSGSFFWLWHRSG